MMMYHTYRRLVAFGLAIVFILSLPTIAAAADPSVLTIEPLASRKLGQDQTLAVIAHLTTASGAPVAGARLNLFVDGQQQATGITDATGTPHLDFRPVLPVGQHRIEVRFDGSREALPASATVPFVVLPADSAGLTIEPPAPRKVGTGDAVPVIAHLGTEDGEPVRGARLALLVNGQAADTGTTDAFGTARLTFRRELPAGAHQIEVKFEGAPGVEPADAVTTFKVLPADASVITIEPLAPRKVGLNQQVTVVARLTMAAGGPIAGGRLTLLVDGKPVHGGSTEADGVAKLTFRGELPAGQHRVEVRYEGARGVLPASVTTPFTMVPPDASVLTVEPLSSLKLGPDQSVAVVAQLATAAGEPIAGARLALFVNGVQERGRSTDATGTASLTFRRGQTAGQYDVQVRYAGTKGVLPSSASTPLTILPHELTIQTIPPLLGVQVKVQDQILTSGDDGAMRTEIKQIGTYRVEVLPWQPSEPGVQAQFSRWGNDSFEPSRLIDIPQMTHLEAGFDMSYEVGATYVDRDENLVEPGRIASITMSNSMGERYVFNPTEKKWLPGGRIVRRLNGLEETKILYSVDSVVIDGANVVNAKEQRYFLTPNLEYPIRLLLFSARIQARDALFGFPVGVGVELQYPDGHAVWHDFDSNADVRLESLPRGEYRMRVEAPGLSFPTPVALSVDQEVEFKVISPLDIAVVLGLLGLVAVALPLIGRPYLLAIVRPTFGLLTIHRRLDEPGEERPA